MYPRDFGQLQVVFLSFSVHPKHSRCPNPIVVGYGAKFSIFIFSYPTKILMEMGFSTFPYIYIYIYII